jgi:hypothetical protein
LTATAAEVRELIANGTVTLRRPVAAPRVRASMPKGSPPARMLYDLGRAWVDPGFPDVEGEFKGEYRFAYLKVPRVHPLDGWGGGHECSERLYCPFAAPDDAVTLRSRRISTPAVVHAVAVEAGDGPGAWRWAIELRREH